MLEKGKLVETNRLSILIGDIFFFSWLLCIIVFQELPSGINFKSQRMHGRTWICVSVVYYHVMLHSNKYKASVLCKSKFIAPVSRVSWGLVVWLHWSWWAYTSGFQLGQFVFSLYPWVSYICVLMLMVKKKNKSTQKHVRPLKP